MDLYIRRGEVTEKVSVERDGNTYVVSIGERKHQVDALRLPNGLWSLSPLANDQEALRPQREVAVWTGTDGKTRVTSATDAWDLEVTDPLTHLANSAGATSGRRRSQKVTALMPGRVVAVLAEAGQTVETGQGIVVLEAMKMQNEILADHEGTLKAVFVTAGQPVEKGDPLFELE